MLANSSIHPHLLQGKYFEIKFSRGGQPLGGTISNFLLEKSRVVGQKGGERNYHVFYQLTKGTSAQEKEWLGMAKPDCFFYLNQSRTYDADGVNDVEDYKDMRVGAVFTVWAF